MKLFIVTKFDSAWRLHGTVTILAEDEEHARQQLAKMLRKRGFKPGTEAHACIEEIDTNKPLVMGW